MKDDQFTVIKDAPPHEVLTFDFPEIATDDHWKKWKNPLYVKIMRNWWNFNRIREKSIPLSGILMGY